MDKFLNSGRLVYIVGDFGNGGQERQLLYLLRQLKPIKEDVTVIVWNYNEDDYHSKSYRDLGYDLIAIDKTKPLWRRALLLRKIVKERKGILLHSYTFYLNFFCWLSCLGLSTLPIGGIRSRITLHMSELGHFWSYMCMAFPRRRISNNEHYKEGAKAKFLNTILKSTYVVTNHLDLNNFLPNIPTDIGTIRTASIGRFTEEKRIDVIVDIIKELKKRGVPIVHTHAGKGPLMKKIEQKINDEGLAAEFLLKGEVSDVNSFLADKHFFIHAAHTEGYPNVIMEAMACAKPIVTSDCGDVREMIEVGQSGYIHHVDDISGMIKSCETLARNVDLRHSFAMKSRSIAEAKFSLGHLLEQTIDTYRKICAE